MFDNDVRYNAFEYLPYLKTEEGKITEVNSIFTDFTGYDGNGLVGLPIAGVMNNLLKSGVMEDPFEIPEAEPVYIYTKNLSPRYVDILTRSGHGDKELYCIFAEKPHSRFETRYPYLYQILCENDTGVAIYSCPGLQLLYANDKYIAEKDVLHPFSDKDSIIGYKAGSLQKNRDAAVIDGLLACSAGTEKTMREKEYLFTARDGSERYLDFTITPVKEKGRIEYLVFILEDITGKVLYYRNVTEQLKTAIIMKTHVDALLKEEMEKKEALDKAIKMKDEFIYTLTHEFKTPLTVIISAIQAMESLCRDDLTDKLREYMAKIRQNALRQMRLVNNMLEMTRIKTGHVRINKKNHDIIYVTKKIIESITLYASQKNVEVRFASPMAEKIIGIDDEKYERILLNLLSNAIKFSPPGKTVTVDISEIRKYICIKVRDEGVGIPGNKKDHIFTRFGQVSNSLIRQTEGTGIGLSLVKSLVEMMGGSIHVDSKIGAGSTFTVLLPKMRSREKTAPGQTHLVPDDRLIQSVSIEFSDIYMP